MLLGLELSEVARVRLSWLAFDVQGCECYHQEDKDRILKVIDCLPSGSLGFNQYIRDLTQTVLHDSFSGTSATVFQTGAEREAIQLQPVTDSYWRPCEKFFSTE